MPVLSTIIYILLFLFFISLLIIFHELGHLAAAKAFNVYCLEFSVGMGPLIFKRKRKGGETQFSLRAIPFGGYVAMYGEGVELPEGVKIDESRSLNGVKWWKRAIILLAGILMNSLLALVFFAVSNTFPQQILYRNQLSIAPPSIASDAGIEDGTIFKIYQEFNYDDPVSESKKTFYLVDKETTINDDDSIKYATCLNYESLDSFSKRDLADYIFIYEQVDNNPDFAKKVDMSLITTAKINFTSMVKDAESGEMVVDQIYPIVISKEGDKFASFGASLYLETWTNDFKGVVTQTFTDFGNSSVLLFKAIGDLFTKPSSWNNMGGIIAVGFETTAVLQNFGIGKFLFYWGFISVNLAIFNLLPFPGLDGWHLLVLIIEGITRRKVPEKVKNIVSFVGLAALLVLMGVIVIKDLLKYVFFLVL